MTISDFWQHASEDFESKILFVPQAVRPSLDDPDLGVDALDESQGELLLRRGGREPDRHRNRKGLDPQPAPVGAPLNYFMYPYAEADGKPLNEDLFGFNLGYKITFREL